MEVYFNLEGDSYNMILFLKDWSQSSLKKYQEELLAGLGLIKVKYWHSSELFSGYSRLCRNKSWMGILLISSFDYCYV